MKSCQARQHYEFALPPPELGPQIVFFTGGTALRAVSQELIKYTHNSVHLITPFDSGGSSAVLRAAFDMPAVGDMRNRLLALADPSRIPADAIELYNMRLPKDAGHKENLLTLLDLANGNHPGFASVPRILVEILRVHLRYFLEKMPEDFDLRGASIGNLVIAGGYLHHSHLLSPVLTLLNRILQARGHVYPIANTDMHLAAQLENGAIVIGQHNLTGKAASALPSPVRKLFLTEKKPGESPEEIVPRRPRMIALGATLIGAADLICYPMGSFHTSIMANMLPSGVGSAIAGASCPKIYIPNSGTDPEQRGLSIAAQIKRLTSALNLDCENSAEPRNFLHAVLVDKQNGHYPYGVDEPAIEAMGIRILDRAMVDPANTQRHLPASTVSAVLGCI